MFDHLETTRSEFSEQQLKWMTLSLNLQDGQEIKCRLFAAVNVRNQEAIVVHYNDPDRNLPFYKLIRKHVLKRFSCN